MGDRAPLCSAAFAAFASILRYPTMAFVVGLRMRI